MESESSEVRADNLPASAREFIRQVVRKMGYHRKARQDVEAELTAHFEDELRDCANAQEREQRAQRLVEGFGDAKLLALLCRRAKKRCRPLWAKALIRSLQATGVFVVLLGLYVVWFVNGKPSIKVDYLALLNQISRPDVAEQDNAWPYYEQAIALAVPDHELVDIPAYQHPDYPEHREFARLTEDVQRAIATWVEANRAAWEQFEVAGAKPYCAKSYRYSDSAREPWLMSVALPELSPLVQLSKTGVWLSRLRVMQGRTGDALEACLAVARAGRHWQQSGTLTEQFIGIVLSRRAHDEILAILGHQSLAAAELANLQRELGAVYPQSYPLISFQEQRLVFLDMVQHLFTDGGPGGGHLIPSRTAEVMTLITGLQGVPGHEPLLNWRAASFLHAGRDETLAKGREIFDLQDKFARMSPYERRALDGTRADVAFVSRSQAKYALVQMLAPMLDRQADLGFRAKVLHQATLAAVALQRHRQEKGSYPGTLEELKQAGYLDTPPVDPYGKGPLVYKVTGDAFTLYSVGPDFLDNGGQSGTDSRGRRQMWADHGDTVFWPVP